MTATSLHWLLTALAMAAVTFALRAAPTLLPKRWLKSDLLLALNAALPLCVMTLLVLGSLTWPGGGATRQLGAELLALGVVLGLYLKTRNTLVSMAAGVAALNGALWLLRHF